MKYSLFFFSVLISTTSLLSQIKPKIETKGQAENKIQQESISDIVTPLSEDGCEIYDLKNSNPTLLSIKKIHFATDEVAYAVGSSGLVLKSVDAGNTWDQVAKVDYRFFEHLHFTDELNGYIKTYNKIFRTSDGGETWTDIGFSLSSSGDLTFIDDTLGFFSDNETLYRTIDNENWNSIKVFDGEIKGIETFNETELIVNTQTGIYHSTDNGESWSTLYENASAQMDDVVFVSLDIWYMTTSYLSGIGGVAFISTTNRGVSWDTTKLDVFNSFQPGIYFIDENVGFVYGGDEAAEEPSANAPYAILKTTNGGETWTETNATTTWNRWDNDMVFTDENTGFVVGGFGSIQKTSDGGDNWTSVTTNDTQFLQDVLFNGDIGLIGGEAGVIFKTTDGGLTWGKRDSNTDLWIQKFSWTSNAVYAVCSIWSNSSSEIIKSIDGGETWSIVSTLAANLRTIHFYDDMNGIAAGPLGHYYETTDGGDNWIPSTFPDNPNILTSAFPSSEVGYLAGEQYLLKTINGGDNWTSINTTDFGEVYTMHFINEEIGFLAGNYGQIYKTTDGGVTFDTLKVVSNPDIYGIHFFDESRGYVATSFDIQFTSNGGQSWHRISLPTGNELRDIHLHENQRATVIGRGGAIFDLLIGEPSVQLEIIGNSEWCIEDGVQTLNLSEFAYIDNYSLNWSLSDGGQIDHNGTSASVEWTEEGTYTVSIFPANSCGQGPSTSFEIEVVSKPESVAISHESNEIESTLYWCIDDGSQMFEISESNFDLDLDYEWSVTGENLIEVIENQAIIDWETTGSFEVSLTVSNQCGSSESTVAQVIVTNSEGVPVLSLEEEKLLLEAVDGIISWFLNDSPIEGVTESNFEPLENGTYKASITNSCGVFFSNEILIDYILSLDSDATQFVIYPNPSADIISIGGIRKDDQVEVLDLQGKVYRLNQSQEKEFRQINVTELSPGIYIVRISQDGTTRSETIKIN